MKRLLILLAVTIMCGATVLAETITTGALLREMVDLRRLGEFPSPAYKTVQFSSYDHRSAVPGGKDWFGNSDGFGGEPVPNFEQVIRAAQDDGDGEYLVCDVEGPGAVVRVWTATISGSIQLFLDGGDEPDWQGPAQEFFQPNYRIISEHTDIDPKLFQDTYSQRNAGYFPIPFAKRLRVVWLGNPKNVHFYQIQVRLYNKNADVRSFSPEDLKEYKQDIIRTAQILKDADKNWPYQSTVEPVTIAATIPVGEKIEVLALEGPKAIERLTLKVHASDMNKALRQTVLHVICDEALWGQVQSPLGDFFGAAPGINPYNSVPFTVHPDGSMTCRFVMPFEKSCKIVLENKGNQNVTVTGSALPMEYKWNPETSMHFRARWRVEHDLTASPQAPQDIPFLAADGKGVYVGTASILMNTGNIPLSFGNWWGEGDEKIFVDEDFRPSTFGTGSEDYYNYAWSSVDIWGQPYCGQPRNDGPGNRGFVTNHRWHILDPLPFQQRINFYMELYSADPMPGFSYARLGYHYAKPGTVDDHLPITPEDVRDPNLPADWSPVGRMGASNSVFYQAEELIDAKAPVSLEKDNLWSEGKVMVWRPRKSGEELTLSLPILEDGNYFIRLANALDHRSGSYAAQVDGKSIKIEGQEEMPLQNPLRTLNRVHSTDRVSLKKGEHTLTLKATGEVGIIGLDFVWIQKE